MTFMEGSSEEVLRTYGLFVPESYTRGTPAPLVFVFHGWSGDGHWYHDHWGFGQLARKQGFVAVYPQGLADCAGLDCKWNGSGYRSWNGVGTTESFNGGRLACDPTRKRGDHCYESCRVRKGSCHPCDWTTCSDDVGF